MKKLIPVYLSNTTAMLVLTGHPWLFRNKFSRYEKDLVDGDWVQLYGAGNKEIGVGIYSQSGLIAVRIFFFGENFSLSILQKKIEKRLEKRIKLLKFTNSIRWIHGENDSLPGITIDGHGNCLVTMCYSPSLKLFSRYIAKYVFYKLSSYTELKIKTDTIIFSSPNRKGFESKELNNRIMRGTKPGYIKIFFDNLSYSIDPFGQKSGMYNDIRNLRTYILKEKEKFTGKNVLNLFSSNGLLSFCLEYAGSNQIISVEDSNKAISMHKLNLENSNSKNWKYIEFKSEQQNIELDSKQISQIICKADIFKNLKEILKYFNIKFDFIIIDPPSLTANESDKKNARILYKKLISESLSFLTENGTLILCSCSNRIHPNDFEKICKEAITENKRKAKSPIRLQNEIDHPILTTFPEGNYFKAHIYHDLHSI